MPFEDPFQNDFNVGYNPPPMPRRKKKPMLSNAAAPPGGGGPASTSNELFGGGTPNSAFNPFAGNRGTPRVDTGPAPDTWVDPRQREPNALDNILQGGDQQNYGEDFDNDLGLGPKPAVPAPQVAKPTPDVSGPSSPPPRTVSSPPPRSRDEGGGYRDVLPRTRDEGRAERERIYDRIFSSLDNPTVDNEYKGNIRELYRGIPGFTENLVGDWRSGDYGLLGDVRERYSKHGEGVGDRVKNALAERGAGAIRGLHDDVSRERSAAFARNPYAVDSNLGLDRLGKTGQQFADNSRKAALEGELLDNRAKEFGLSGIRDIDFRRFDASERGDERYRGSGISSELGLLDREQGEKSNRLNQLLSLYPQSHGPTGQEMGYDISRRGQELQEMLTRLGIGASGGNAREGREFAADQSQAQRDFEAEQRRLDREYGRESQESQQEASKKPWWSYLLPF